MKGDTPRTDALERKLHLQRHVKVISTMTAHSRQLERELADCAGKYDALVKILERKQDRIDVCERRLDDSTPNSVIGEFQDQIRDLVIRLTGAPSELIDGKGSDAGWQDFSLAEISQAIAWLKDHHADELAEAKAELLKVRNELSSLKFLVGGIQNLKRTP